MHAALRDDFLRQVALLDFASLRLVKTYAETLSVRQDVQEPLQTQVELGAMVTVIHGGGYGYAATADLSGVGLERAVHRAQKWAEASASRSVFDYSALTMPQPEGEYHSRVVDAQAWNRRAMLDLLMAESQAAHVDDRIVDWGVSVQLLREDHTYVTYSRRSGQARTASQHYRFVIPGLSVTANANGDSQTRSLGGQYSGYCRQGGMEIIDAAGLVGAGRRVADEALELLAAPNCPSGVMDLLLMPEQMMLQIHESIGHPLELDRILGDERNYAGTSFVTPEMFGTYRYGSDLLNVSFDPTIANEFASYRWDDDGAAAEKVLLIERGLLQRPLGGAISQARAGLPGVSNTRACAWNRPPIDRMANLNIEPGNADLPTLIGSIERGVLMDTNVSWSIDDSRNKFQFGCERGMYIENGVQQYVVKNPNYRGVSATFWRNLKGVGDRSTADVMGTPFCGKGEPNQVIRVGHASPACLFGHVDVFGGAS